MAEVHACGGIARIPFNLVSAKPIGITPNAMAAAFHSARSVADVRKMGENFFNNIGRGQRGHNRTKRWNSQQLTRRLEKTRIDVRGRRKSDQSLLQSFGNCLRFGVDVELLIDAANVKAHSVDADVEMIGCGFVTVAFDQFMQDFLLTAG